MGRVVPLTAFLFQSKHSFVIFLGSGPGPGTGSGPGPGTGSGTTVLFLFLSSGLSISSSGLGTGSFSSTFTHFLQSSGILGLGLPDSLLSTTSSFQSLHSWGRVSLAEPPSLHSSGASGEMLWISAHSMQSSGIFSVWFSTLAQAEQCSGISLSFELLSDTDLTQFAQALIDSGLGSGNSSLKIYILQPSGMTVVESLTTCWFHSRHVLEIRLGLVGSTTGVVLLSAGVVLLSIGVVPFIVLLVLDKDNGSLMQSSGIAVPFGPGVGIVSFGFGPGFGIVSFGFGPGFGIVSFGFGPGFGIVSFGFGPGVGPGVGLVSFFSGIGPGPGFGVGSGLITSVFTHFLQSSGI